MTTRPGFALIGALWLMVAVSAAATAFAFSARSHRLAVANTTESVQARYAALSALQLLLSRLDERVARANAIPLGMPPEPNPWRDLAEVLPPQLEIGPSVAHIEILDSGAKLNLNTASASELTRFFIALGESPANSERLVENIIDWRDLDLIREDGGLESSAYEAVDAPHLPANAPFEDARDLQFGSASTRSCSSARVSISRRRAMAGSASTRHQLRFSSHSPGSARRRSARSKLGAGTASAFTACSSSR